MITPAGWTFSIWGFIFAWQIIWMIYALTTICRVTEDGTPICQLPIQTNLFYGIFILNSCLTVAWLFIWDRQHMGWAFLDLSLCALTLYTCIIITHRNLYRSIRILEQQGVTKDIWLIRFLVQNGIVFFATWVTIATLLNFGITLHYIWDVDLNLASTIPLACLSFIILCWFVMETFVLDKYIRYTFSEYIVLIVALIGSVVANYDLDTNYRNSIFLVVLLGVVGLLALTKVAVMIYRYRKRPIRGNFQDDFKGQLA